MAYENKGAMTATIVVAASDSLNKAAANYKCDGIADDVEIQAAIDALPAGGGKVVLLEGTYNITAQINFNIANSTIEAMGDSTLLYLVDGSECHVIQMSAAHCCLKSLKINANAAGQVGPVLYGAYITATDCVCENVTVLSAKQTGLHVGGGGDRFLIAHCHVDGCKYNYSTAASLIGGTISDCYSNNANDRAYYITGGVGATDVSQGISVVNCKALNSASGIVLNGARFCKVIGCYVYNISTGAGIGTTDTKSVGNDHIEISGNIVDTMTALGGISCAGVVAAHSMYFNIKGNIIYNTYGSGIDITYCDDSCVNDNIIQYIRTEAIKVVNSTRVNVLDNVGRDIVGTGARAAIRFDTVTYSRVEGNNFSDLNWLAMTALFEEIAGACDYNVVKNNTVQNCTQAPIVVLGTHDITDRSPISIKLDLSGAATDIEVYFADTVGCLVGYTVVYTEASSADAGVDIRVGRYQSGVALDDDYFDLSTSEVSKNLGYSKTFVSADLTNAQISAGDTITVGTAGGKAGTGEVMIVLHIAEMLS